MRCSLERVQATRRGGPRECRRPSRILKGEDHIDRRHPGWRQANSKSERDRVGKVGFAAGGVEASSGRDADRSSNGIGVARDDTRCYKKAEIVSGARIRTRRTGSDEAVSKRFISTSGNPSFFLANARISDGNLQLKTATRSTSYPSLPCECLRGVRATRTVRKEKRGENQPKAMITYPPTTMSSLTIGTIFFASLVREPSGA